MEQEPKWLYRLESKSPDNGLWYDANNNYVFGIGKLEECKTKDLPMGYDERYHENGLNWFSSCSNYIDLWHWYSLDDAKNLMDNGFVFTKYLATDYREYPNETCFLKETALSRVEISFDELVMMYNEANGIFQKANGTKLALDMYDNFYKELITALTNIKGIKDALAMRAIFSKDSGPVYNYWSGQAAAFAEIIERVQKEYELARTPVTNTFKGFPMSVYNTLNEEKNKSAESLIPDDKYRGSKEYWPMMKFRGKIADLLESFTVRGFELGVKYKEVNDN